MRSPRQAVPRLSLEDSTLSPAVESTTPQAGSSQASPEENTLSPAESALSQAARSQAGSSQASLEGRPLSLAESVLSQAGSSQASPEDSTLSLAGQVHFPKQAGYPGFPRKMALFHPAECSSPSGRQFPGFQSG